MDFTIANFAPVAEFTYLENELMITVSASESSDPEIDGLTYEWDFNSESTQYGVTENHIFNSEGDKTVTLIVTDSAQNESTIIKTISVSIEENLAPSAVINYSVTDLTVSVDASKSSDDEESAELPKGSVPVKLALFTPIHVL